MSIFLGILLALLVFLVVVLVHEFGHFSTARLTGMKVLEFGFGLPPRAFRLFKDKKGTEYTWNWLPIGGFVRILGEDPTGPDARKKGAFMTRPWAARVLVLVAGVTMNFFLAFLIFTGLFYVGTEPVAVNPLAQGPTNSFFLPSLDEAVGMGYARYDGVEISALSGSLAETAGIGQKDQVIAINGIYVHTPDEFMYAVKLGIPLDLILDKDGAKRVVQLTPKDGKIGVQVMHRNLEFNKNFRVSFGFFDAIKQGAYETYASSVMTLDFLGQMLHGIFTPDSDAEYEDAKNMLSGPIGVGATFVGLVEIAAPISLILIVTALISINLGIINLLPIPALDGGRIITTTLYSLVVRYAKAGRERFLQFEKYFHAIGFILLLLLTVYIAGVDISRFF